MSELTVILPIYNAEAFLQEAIESILGQTYQSFELWLMDDGSSDRSPEIIRKYGKSTQIKLFLNTENRGKLAVVNEAISLVSTKYFTVHDADDISMLDRFERQIELMETVGYAMTGTSYESIDVAGQSLSIHIQSEDLSHVRKEIFKTAQFHGPTMIVRTDILNEVGGFYRIMKMGEDIDFSMRVVEKYPAINLPDVLYQYRINPDSMTKSVAHDLLAKLVDRKLIYDMAKERQLDGVDSLMKNDLERIAQLKVEARADFHKNRGKYVEEYVAYLLHYRLYKNALIFCLRMSFRYPLDGGVHRKTMYALKRLITE